MRFSLGLYLVSRLGYGWVYYEVYISIRSRVKVIIRFSAMDMIMFRTSVRFGF